MVPCYARSVNDSGLITLVAVPQSLRVGESREAAMPTAYIGWPATLRRLEHVVEVLANCHDRCGFVLDQDEARRALTYCQRRIAGEPEQEDDDSLIEFIAASGQSVDWVLFGDPGVMICKLAAGTRRPGMRFIRCR
jgi:hypothetical protein